MAASEVEVEIVRGAQTQDRYRAHADPDSNGEMRDVLGDWLDAERITDPDMRRRYVLRWFTNRLHEVHV